MIPRYGVTCSGIDQGSISDESVFEGNVSVLFSFVVIKNDGGDMVIWTDNRTYILEPEY
jgi:hypothetical protein